MSEPDNFVDVNEVVKDLQEIMEATPEHQLKPQLVWLGKFLGMDIYMDVQPIKNDPKHTQLARRVFKAKLEEMN